MSTPCTCDNCWDSGASHCDGCGEKYPDGKLKQMFYDGLFCASCAEDIELKLYDLCADAETKKSRRAA